MKRYLMIALVLLVSCGLVGYGNWLPQKESAGAAESSVVPVIEETMKEASEASAPETNTLALSVASAVPTVKTATFETLGTACVRGIIEPVVSYMEVEVQKAEEEKAAEELEKENRDESQRVYSTAMIGSVVAVEDMAIATSAPLDMSVVLLATKDASGNQTYLFNEDGELKMWRDVSTAETSGKIVEAAQEIQESEESQEETAEEESYEEESIDDTAYEEESYEEESYEETSYDEESYEESSDDETSYEVEEESSEEESSEESEEESVQEEEAEEESSEESEDETTAEEDSENEEDSEDENDSENEDDSEDEEETIPTYDIPSDGDYYYDYSWEIFNKTNELRASLGIAPLSWSDDLASFAAVRAQEITVSFSHYRPGGGHYSNYGPQHENIAWGYPTVDDVFEGWYTSPDHYDNLTDPTMSSVGISSYRYQGIMYWVMSFW